MQMSFESSQKARHLTQHNPDHRTGSVHQMAQVNFIYITWKCVLYLGHQWECFQETLTNCFVDLIHTLNVLCKLLYHSLFAAMELLEKEMVGLQVETTGDLGRIDHGSFLSVVRVMAVIAGFVAAVSSADIVTGHRIRGSGFLLVVMVVSAMTKLVHFVDEISIVSVYTSGVCVVGFYLYYFQIRTSRIISSISVLSGFRNPWWKFIAWPRSGSNLILMGMIGTMVHFVMHVLMTVVMMTLSTSVVLIRVMLSAVRCGSILYQCLVQNGLTHTTRFHTNTWRREVIPRVLNSFWLGCRSSRRLINTNQLRFMCLPSRLVFSIRPA